MIDPDYRGEVKVLLVNNGTDDFTVHKGDRVAQLICELIIRPTLEHSMELSPTERVEAGLGSTGIRVIEAKSSLTLSQMNDPELQKVYKAVQRGVTEDDAIDTAEDS